MRLKLSPTLRISLGLSGLIASVCLGAYAVGLAPSAWIAPDASNLRVAKEIAGQLGKEIGSQDQVSLERALKDLTGRNPDILTMGVRTSEGVLIASTPGHAQLWNESALGEIDQGQFIFDLVSQGLRRGQVEIRLKPSPQPRSYAGYPLEFLQFVALMWIGSFVVCYAFLSRTFKELDPKNIVPESVQSAFDTMAEGVMILDMSGDVLLINRSMCAKLGTDRRAATGQPISSFSWSDDDGIEEFPWSLAFRTNAQVSGRRLSLAVAEGEALRFSINVAPIQDARSKMRGLIVTFDDITALHAMNAELVSANKSLEQKQEEIRWKNSELVYLASRDALSGCVNRRVLVEDGEKAIAAARQGGHSLSCLMIDIDHFKSINDTFGHAKGDEVIAGVGRILRSLGDAFSYIVGRYGGEEFCVVMPKEDETSSVAFAEHVRLEIARISPTWFSGQRVVTASIGQATLKPDQALAHLIDAADAGLYEAKRRGRNRVVATGSLEASSLVG